MSVNGQNMTNSLSTNNQFKQEFDEPNGVTIIVEK